MNDEIREIGGGYAVTRDGRVFSSKTWRGEAGRWLAASPSTGGYRMVTINRGGGFRTYKVANLVCEAFHGPKPFPSALVRHLDDVSDNDHADNLAWGTKSDNSRDAVRNSRCTAPDNGRKSAGSRAGAKHYKARLDWPKVRAIRKASAEGQTGTSLAKEYGVHIMTISDILRGKTWNEEHCDE